MARHNGFLIINRRLIYVRADRMMLDRREKHPLEQPGERNHGVDFPRMDLPVSGRSPSIPAAERV